MKISYPIQGFFRIALRMQFLQAISRHRKKSRARSESASAVSGHHLQTCNSKQRAQTTYCVASQPRARLFARTAQFEKLSIINYQLSIVSVWGEYIDELIQMKTAVATGGGNLPAGDYYPLQDLLYRTTALTDSTGAIVETYDTDAYGSTLIFKAVGTGGSWWADDAVQTNNPACEIIYCGYRYDPETKLYYVRNRTYNPGLGRWIQRDPLGYVEGMNLYEYVKGKPVRLLDSTGKQIEMLLPPPGTFYPHHYKGEPCGCAKWAPAWQVGGYKSLKDCAEASSHPSEKIGLLGDVIGYLAELFETAGGEELSVVSFAYDIGNYIGGYIGCARQVCASQKQYRWDGCKWVCGEESSPQPTAPPPNVPQLPINVPTIGQFFGGLAGH